MLGPGVGDDAGAQPRLAAAALGRVGGLQLGVQAGRGECAGAEAMSRGLGEGPQHQVDLRGLELAGRRGRRRLAHGPAAWATRRQGEDHHDSGERHRAHAVKHQGHKLHLSRCGGHNAERRPLVVRRLGRAAIRR